MTLYVVGIGSDVGDDQVGWLIANRLQDRRADAQAHCCRSPMELLARLPVDDSLLIVDAVRSGHHPPGTIHRLQWPATTRLAAWQQPASSHGLSLADALSLADQLTLLPRTTLLWGIEIPEPTPTPDLSAPVLSAVDSLIRSADRYFPVQTVMDCG
ncbi:MAG: hydrogenase maturation protease [Gammaproteobacteria bacterium]|jgi:hydrogenase maturation protease